MPFKFAFIGQDIPMHLPFLLVDFLYAGKEDGILAVEEKNAAMRDVLQHYAEAICLRQRPQGADHRFRQSAGSPHGRGLRRLRRATAWRRHASGRIQEALGGVKEDDPGLSDQARVHGGIEGLLHTLRQGEVVLDLCRNMRSACPKAIVVTLGQPVARTTQLFLGAGFQAYGLDDAAYRGNTVPRLAKALFRKEDGGRGGHGGAAGLLVPRVPARKGQEC